MNKRLAPVWLYRTSDGTLHHSKNVNPGGFSHMESIRNPKTPEGHFWQVEGSGMFATTKDQLPYDAAYTALLMETVAAVAGDFVASPHYTPIYERYGDELGGFTGIWQLITELATTLENWLGPAWRAEKRDFIEDVEDVVAGWGELYLNNGRVTEAELRTIVNPAADAELVARAYPAHPVQAVPLVKANVSAVLGELADAEKFPHTLLSNALRHWSPEKIRDVAAFLAKRGAPEPVDQSPAPVDPDTSGDEYDVTVRATVTKTLRVRATSAELATEQAHELFTVACENDQDEDYNEDTLRCEKVIPEIQA